MYSFKMDAQWIHRALPLQSGAQNICEWKSDNKKAIDYTVTVNFLLNDEYLNDKTVDTECQVGKETSAD